VRPSDFTAKTARFADGVHDVYVARRETCTAGSLTKIRLFEDQDNEYILALEPGTFVRLRDVAGADTPLASLEVRVGELGTLPFVEFIAWGSRTMVTPAELHEMLQAPRTQRTLGPFPAASVDVVVTPKEGKPRTVRVSGASVIQK